MGLDLIPVRWEALEDEDGRYHEHADELVPSERGRAWTHLLELCGYGPELYGDLSPDDVDALRSRLHLTLCSGDPAAAIERGGYVDPLHGVAQLERLQRFLDDVASHRLGISSSS